MVSMKLSKVSNALMLASMLSVGVALVSSNSAYAGSAPANLAVSAAVTANCTISTGALGFGSYDPVVANAATALNGTGSVTVACTKGSAPTIALDLGLNGASPLRQMKITGVGTDLLQYQVYQPPNTTPGTACSFPAATVWNAGAGIFTPTAPATKAARTYNVCGTVLAGQDVSVGSYQDTIVATVNF